MNGIFRLLDLPQFLIQLVFLPYLALDDIIALTTSIELDNDLIHYIETFKSKIKHSIISYHHQIYQIQLDWLQRYQIYLTDISFSDDHYNQQDIKTLLKRDYLNGFDIFRYIHSIKIPSNIQIPNSTIVIILNRCTQLKSFHMYESCYSSKDGCSFGMKLQVFLQDYKELESLTLCSTGLCDVNLMLMIHRLSNLRSLDLIDCKSLTLLSIQCILKNCKRLKSLHINNFKRTSWYDKWDFFGFNSNDIFDLKELQSLSLCKFSGGFRSITKECIQLEILDLSYCDITDDVIISIAKYCKRLKSLSIGGNPRINDASIILLTEECKYLTILDISDCIKLTDASIIAITHHCTEMKSLYISGNSKITDTSIISIGKHCRNLKLLNLSYCLKITDVSIHSLVHLCKNNILNRLYLLGCKDITDTSMNSIPKYCTIVK